MNLLTVSFEAVGNANGKATLNDVMGTAGLTSYGDAAGDYINTWNISAGNWGQTYFYVNDPSWNYDNVDYTDTWMDGDFVPQNPEMDPGSSFWLYANNDIPALQFAGQVASGTVSYTLAGGQMNLCGNPYPMSLNLADKSQVTITGATSYGDQAGDYINTWNVAAANWGTTYFYVNDASWNYGDVDYTDTWMDGDFVPCATEIGAGSGFWYYAVADGVTLTFSAK
ncbi:MAG: hypothetical protein SPJ23_01570 [Eubacteriales bacterium]|nr:hypothetical protein [Eubacteriales bacterium]